VKKCTFLGGEKYASASCVIPLIADLQKQLKVNDNDPGFAIRFKETLVRDLNERLEKIEENLVLQTACALDCRFKALKCIPKDSREAVWAFIKNLVNKYNENQEPVSKKKCTPLRNVLTYSESDSETDDDSSGLLTHEVDLYRQVPPTDEFVCPLEWWHKNSSGYSVLSKIARKYLSIPATSVPCERLFSKADNIIEVKRS
jgi:hypothetical protein